MIVLCVFVLCVFAVVLTASCISSSSSKSACSSVKSLGSTSWPSMVGNAISGNDIDDSLNFSIKFLIKFEMSSRLRVATMGSNQVVKCLIGIR